MQPLPNYKGYTWLQLTSCIQDGLATCRGPASLSSLVRFGSKAVAKSKTEWFMIPGNCNMLLHMTSNGLKWGCAQAIQSLSVSGVELANSKVYWLPTLGILPLVDPNLLNSSFVSPLPLSLTPSVVPASPPTPLPWLSYLFYLTMHFPTLSIFVLHRPGRSSSSMVKGLDVNHPAPPLPLLKSSRPPPLILFLSLEGTLSVVTLMLVLSLISTKCSRITSPSLSTLRIIAMAPTLSLFPRNISLRPLLSTPLVYNKPGPRDSTLMLSVTEWHWRRTGPSRQANQSHVWSTKEATASSTNTKVRSVSLPPSISSQPSLRNLRKERPTKSHRKFTVDGFEKEEEEEERANPQTRRQLERMHTVFRNNLLMCTLPFPQFHQFDITKSDLDEWYDWFYGPSIAGRRPPPSEFTLLWSERNAWRQIYQLMADGSTLKTAMKTIKEDQLFWTREVYERVLFQQLRTPRDPKGKGKGKDKEKKGGKTRGQTQWMAPELGHAGTQWGPILQRLPS